MGRRMHLEIIQKRLQRPVRWLTSRDSSRLNNLGIALMSVGASVAVTTGAVKFTNQLVPWWSIIVGLAMFVAGVALTGYTMGATGSPAIEIPSEAGESSGTQRSIIDSEIDIGRRQAQGQELRDG